MDLGFGAAGAVCAHIYPAVHGAGGESAAFWNRYDRQRYDRNDHAALRRGALCSYQRQRMRAQGSGEALAAVYGFLYRGAVYRHLFRGGRTVCSKTSGILDLLNVNVEK